MSDPTLAPSEPARNRQDPSEAAGEELSARQERALLALLSSPTVALAARRAGVGESTLRSWLKDKAFLVEYRLARHQVMEQAVGRLQRTARRAVRTLGGCLSEGNKTSDRIRAAVAILSLGAAGAKQFDVVQMLVDLERTMQEILARQDQGRRS
jgi:hypothetical protein